MSGPVCGKVSKVRRPNKRSPWFSEEPEFGSGRLNCEPVIRRCGVERAHRQNVCGFTSESVCKYRCASGTFVFDFNVILIFILIFIQGETGDPGDPGQAGPKGARGRMVSYPFRG